MKAHIRMPVRAVLQLAAFSGLSLGLSGPAQAVDGCKLLLCLAGSWQSIGQCVPTVRQALRDLARGRVWPSCGMGGSSGSANQFVAPEQCPPQYITVAWTDESGRVTYSCPYVGVIHVAVQGQAWSRTWWSMTGDSVTEWLPAGRAAMVHATSAMDSQFDRDLAAWLDSAPGRRASGPVDPAAATTPVDQGGGE